MEKIELPFREGIFSERKEYKLTNSGKNGNKEEWSNMMQAYYQDLPKKIELDQEFYDFNKIKQEIASRYTNKSDQRVTRSYLQKWQSLVEVVLGRQVNSIYDYLNPIVIEAIPLYLSAQWGDKRKKILLKKFYLCVFDLTGLSAAFDPLAARVMKHLQRKPSEKKLPQQYLTGNQQLDIYLMQSKLRGSSFNSLKYRLRGFFRWVAQNQTGSQENYLDLLCINAKLKLNQGA